VAREPFNAFDHLPAPRAEPTPRWVRARFGGETVADSTRAVLLVRYGPDGLPTYFFPRDDVRLDLLEEEGERDGRRRWTVRAGDREAPGAAWAYEVPPPGLEALAGHLTFEWGAMDAWLEEDEEVHVHARDPHHRVDVMASSRHVVVSVGGQVVADTRRPHLLFETYLPVRCYLPREDVRMDLLEPTDLGTHCPYKGRARYWSVRAGGELHGDIAWSYEDPIHEQPKIAGLVAFFDERVDVVIDGEAMPRPITPWSR
jgi:uncharacterized protein (DUF427 family)